MGRTQTKTTKMMVRSTLLLMAMSIAMGSVYNNPGRLSLEQKQKMLDAIKEGYPKRIDCLTQKEIDDNPRGFPIDVKGKSLEEVKKEMMANAKDLVSKIDINKSSPEFDEYLEMLYDEVVKRNTSDEERLSQLRDQIVGLFTELYEQGPIDELRKYAREVEPELADLPEDQLRATMIQEALQMTDEAYYGELADVPSCKGLLESFLKELEQHKPAVKSARSQVFVRDY